MAEIKFLDNGPIVASGATLLDGEGNQMESKSEVYLCRCGLSNNKPYCDGSHKDKFESTIRA
jgi:CDGSH-type Zn-finger protein